MNLIKKILIIITAFFIFDSVISTALLKLSKISQIRYSRLYYEKINADILFIGNSRAINTFYSPYFDKLSNTKSINLSYNGLTLPLINVFVNDYLNRNKAPKIIFIEVTCITDGYFGFPNFKQYMFDSPMIKKIIKEYYPKIYYTSIISKLYLFNSEYFLRTLYYLKKQDQNWINRYKIKEEFYNNLLKTNENIFLLKTIEESLMKMFIELITVCRQKGITIIPVLAPILDRCRNENNIDNYISDFEKRTKLKIINLSRAIDDISMFSDTVHTNDRGAYLIAKKLIDYLNKKNDNSSF